jgi:uncharacterized protein (DUF362 family)
MEKSIVSIEKGNDPESMIEKALSNLGRVFSLIRPGSTVVIKPNSGHLFPPETSVNTNPLVVKAAINVIRGANPREIILAESAAIGCDTMECLELSGILSAAEEAGVDRIIDIKKEKDLINIPIRDALSDLTKIRLPRFLIEADHIVNLPIFKSHVSMVFTCALKNIKGVVQDKVHNQMHRTVLADAIMDAWSVVKADLSIVDMIRPAEGFGPHNPSPVDFGCIVAGKDPVAVDATICRMVGLDVDTVPYFKPAQKRGIGRVKENEIDIRGSRIEDVFKRLWLPYMEGFERWPEYEFHTENACSSCQGLLAFTMENLKALGEYDNNAGINLVMGGGKSLPKGVKPENLIIIGDCLKKYRGKGKGICVGGCPPAEPYILYAILYRKDCLKEEDWMREKYEGITRVFQTYLKDKYQV